MTSTSNSNTTTTSVQDILRQAQLGDKAAFSEIVHQYYRLVISVSYRISGDRDLACDVAQDTFMRAWQQLPRFKHGGDGTLRSWLCRIAHNRTIDLCRAQRQESLDDNRSDPHPLPESRALQNETIDEVQAAILQLPDVSRTALILREYEDLSYAEIADALDIPIGTVMSRLYHARQRLAAALAPLYQEGEAL